MAVAFEPALVMCFPGARVQKLAFCGSVVAGLERVLVWQQSSPGNQNQLFIGDLVLFKT